MRALVTGAGGFVGRRLCEALVARGDAVTALVHSPGAPVEGARVVTGDVRDPATLAEAIRDAEVVFHLAGIRRAPDRQAFLDVNAGGTRRVCEAAAARETPPRIVLAGSLAASGPAREGRPLVETDPLRPADWYGESKAEAERILAGFTGRLPWTVARPSRVLGAGDRENLTFFKLAKKGVRLEVSGPPRPVSLIDVDDVVRALLVLAEHPDAVGEAFFVSAESLTLGEIMDLGAQALGWRLRPVKVPAVLLRAVGAGADVVSKVTGRRLPVNRKLAHQLTAPGWMCSTDKARERLGFTAQVPVAESIRVSARWYVEQGLL